jgi:Zn-finger nucleic acid-binding protein
MNCPICNNEMTTMKTPFNIWDECPKCGCKVWGNKPEDK